MIDLRLERMDLPLKIVWRIATGTTTSKETYFLHAEEDGVKGSGEVTPNQRYGSTPETIKKQFAGCAVTLTERGKGFSSIEELSSWLDNQNFCRALRFGIESAWVHVQAARLKQSVPQFLGLAAPKPVATSYSLPIMNVGEIEGVVKTLSRFKTLKIKVDAEHAIEIVDEVSRVTAQKLRIDGNESFRDPDELMRFVETLKNKNIEFLEQPMPAAESAAYREVLPRMPFPLIADESVEYEADFSELKKQFSGINVKLMKTGGYLPAIRLLRGAREHGMKTMLGCMVETSLGISSAFWLSSLADYIDLDSFLFLKQDPFRRMKEDKGVISEMI